MYTTATFFSLSAVYFFARILRDPQKLTGSIWLGYVLTTSCSLYSHYFALFAIVFENLFLASLWRRYRSLIKSWTLAQIGVALLFLPWLAFMAAGVIGLETSQPERTALIGPNAPAYGLLATWLEGWRGRKSLVNVFRTCLIAFGLGESAQPNLKLPLAVVLLIILIVGTVSLARDRSSLMQRREAAPFLLLYLTVPILLGYLTAFPAERPHWSKYFILASPAYYLLVAAGLAALWKRRVGGLIAGLIFVACASGSSLFNHYFNPQYARPDFRPQIAYIETFSQANDALMVNPRGLFTAFWHYYRGDLTYYPPPEETDIESTLRQISDCHSGLWVVKNVPNDFDPDETIEWWLTHHTYRTMTAWVGHNVFRYYSMPVKSEPVHHPLQVNFAERILLTDYDLAVQATKYGHILQTTLWWQALTEMDEQYLVSLRVLDQSGHLGGRKAIPPLGNFRPTVGWGKGEWIKDHIGLFIWPGTPPGEYWVEVRLVNGSDGQPLVVTQHATPNTQQKNDHILLGPVTIGKAHTPPPIEELQFQYPIGVDLDGLHLLGYSLTSELIRPGDMLPFVLFWQAREKLGRDYLVSLQLQDEDGQASWGEHRSRPVEGAYPTVRWDEGEIVRDQRDWVVPPDVPSGRHRLLVGLIDEASGEQVGQADLGWLTVEGRERVTTVPSIRYPLVTNLNHQVELLGYDLEETSLKPGDTLHLTLYWQTLAKMDKSYTVFIHLLDSDSRIRGQKDSVPGDGTLPTTSWVAGEIITDRYEIAVHSDAQPGRYVLEIGFYDADTGQRLPIVNQEGQRLDDRVLLPTGITLE